MKFILSRVLSSVLSNKYVFVLGLFLCFSLSSCFDLQEAVQIEKDGTGKYAFIMDFSRNIMFENSKRRNTKKQSR